MKNALIDNSITADMGRVVLWQYDNAPHLLGMLSIIESFFVNSTTEFWDDEPENVYDISTANDYGLAVWGTTLGIERPTVTVDNVTKLLSKDLYRRLLKGKYFLMLSNYSDYALNKYLHIVFGRNNTCGVKFTDNLNMSITYSKNDATLGNDALGKEMKALYEQHPELVKEYPAGVYDDSWVEEVVFGITENLVQSPITESSGVVVGGLDDSTFANEYTRYITL